MALFEKVFGEVTDNGDPDKQRRVKVRCPAIVREDAELPFWIRPASAARLWDVPAIGDRVELLIIAGKADNQDAARINERSIRWQPAFVDEDVIPDEILDGYPDVMAVWAPDGSYITINKSTGDLAVVFKDGSRIDVTEAVITLEQKDGNKATLDGDKIELEHKGGDKLTLDGTNITLDGDSKLGAAATYFIVRGDKLLTYLNQDYAWKLAHMHPTAAPGAPSPPSAPPPSVPTDLNSTNQKVE